VKFDRFSDSAGTYVTLDSNNPSIYKQLYRAAKAKLKLRLKATIIKPQKTESPAVNIMDEQPSTMSALDEVTVMPSQPGPRQSYLETVLSRPPPVVKAPSNLPTQPFQSPFASPRPPMPGTFVVKPVVADAIAKPSRPSRAEQLSHATLPSFDDFSSATFSIDCNQCGKSIPSEHYHCGICENGDFDLCQSCVDSGSTCDGEGHWLIKRLIKNGTVLQSTTETLSPRNVRDTTIETNGKLDTAVMAEEEDDDRTCNCCINRKCRSFSCQTERTNDSRTASSRICDMQGLSGLRPLHDLLRAVATRPSSSPCL